MSDPLSSFANEQEEEELMADTAEDFPSANNKADCKVVPSNDDQNSSQQTTQPSADDNISDLLEGELPGDGVDRQDSTMSDYSDILARIEEEVGSGPKDLDVIVDNPEKVIKTMESYIAFSVKTKTTRSDFENPEYCVKRRYNDFLWLRQQLEEKYPGLIIPPLPEKHSMTIDRFDKDFVKFRQVALHRFMGRLATHPTTSKDEMLKTFLTLDANELQIYKKKGTGLLSRMTRSLSTLGGSFMLKNRGEEYTSMVEYAQALGDKMGAIERISTRVVAEQNDYLASVNTYPPALESWAAAEDTLSTNLSHMSKLMTSLHDDYKEMVDESMLNILLPAKEYILFSEAMKSALARRDAVQHELEVITEELVKCTDEKQQLDSSTPGSGGFLNRNVSEESLKAKTEKLGARIAELESARNQCKARLDERNVELKTDLERWHINKRLDMKEMLGGMANRHIDMYDKQITALEGALGQLKESIAS